MKIAAAVVVLVVCSIGVAPAEEIRGKIRTLDQSGRAFTLEDGTQIWVAEGVSMSPLKEGTSVKAAYEERDGKKIGISVGVTPERALSQPAPSGRINPGGAAAGRNPR